MFCKHLLQSALTLTNQSSRCRARAEGCLHWIMAPARGQGGTGTTADRM